MSNSVSLLQIDSQSVSHLNKYNAIDNSAQFVQAIPIDVDFGKTVEIIIPRNNDIIKTMYIYLPNVPQDLDTFRRVSRYPSQFSYNMEVTFIKKINLEIGGNIIYSCSGNTIAAYNDLHNLQCESMIILPFSTGFGIPLIKLAFHEVKLRIIMHDFDELFDVERMHQSSTLTKLSRAGLALLPTWMIPTRLSNALHQQNWQNGQTEQNNNYHIENAKLLVTYCNWDTPMRGHIALAPISCLIEQFMEYPATLVFQNQKHVSIKLPNNGNVKCLYWYITLPTVHRTEYRYHNPIKSVQLMVNNTATDILPLEILKEVGILKNTRQHYLYSFANNITKHRAWDTLQQQQQYNCTITTDTIDTISKYSDNVGDLVQYLTKVGHPRVLDGFMNFSKFDNISLELEPADNMSMIIGANGNNVITPICQIQCFAVVYNIIEYLAGTGNIVQVSHKPRIVQIPNGSLVQDKPLAPLDDPVIKYNEAVNIEEQLHNNLNKIGY